MKKIIFFVTMLIIAVSIFSQQTNPSLSLIQEDYLQKSKNRKKVAAIMLGGGATLILTGIIIPKGEIKQEGAWGTQYKNDNIKSVFYLTGTLSMLGSIPFFISSHHNKKMAAALSFKNESAQQLVKSNFVYKTVPSLSIRLSL